MIVKLLVIHGRPAGKALVFGPGDYFLGRGPECQVRFNSDLVSRQHAGHVARRPCKVADPARECQVRFNSDLVSQHAGHVARRPCKVADPARECQVRFNRRRRGAVEEEEGIGLR
jgi:hypothetical protein